MTVRGSAVAGVADEKEGSTPIVARARAYLRRIGFEDDVGIGAGNGANRWPGSRFRAGRPTSRHSRVRGWRCTRSAPVAMAFRMSMMA